MKIILLGSNGQLGSDIVRLHQKQSKVFELMALSRKEIDLTQKEKVISFLENQDFKILINCTGYNRVDDAETHAQEAFAINAHAVKILAEICENKKARFIHISTDYVFNGEKSSPYLETDPIGPLSIYGSSKAMGEDLAHSICPDTLLLRVASLFGIAGSSGKGGNFIETIIHKAQEKKELRIVNDISMSPTSTLDVAHMILTLIEKEAPSGIYHAVNSGQATWFEFAKEIIQQTKMACKLIPITRDEYPTAALRPAYSVLDNSKISKITGTIPHWREALEKYLREKGHIS